MFKNYLINTGLSLYRESEGIFAPHARQDDMVG